MRGLDATRGCGRGLERATSEKGRELMGSFRQRISMALREKVLQHYLIPSNRYGVPRGLVEALSPSRPVSLVDVGASNGDFAMSIRNHFGLSRALVVEPQPARCKELSGRLEGKGVKVAECALSDHEGYEDLEVLHWDYSSSLLPLLRDESTILGGPDFDLRERIHCRVRTLDDLLVQEDWQEPVDLLKLDVQGAEMMVLRGAERSLPRVRMVFVEVSFRPIYEGSAVFADVYAFLRERGFRMLSMEDAFRGTDGELLQADVLFSR